MPYRRSQCTFDTPATAVDSVADGRDGNAETLGPLGYAHRFSHEGKESIVSRIANLLELRGPLAIARFVVPIVLLAINGVRLRRLRPHVSQKRIERIAPLFAYRYSAPAVICVLFVAGAIAPSQHCVPSPELGGVSVASSVVPVFCVSRDGTLSSLLSHETATTLVVSVFEPLRLYQNGVAASAFAEPKNRATVAGVLDYRQLVECLPDQILDTVVFGQYDVLSHKMLLVNEGRLWLEPEQRYNAARLAYFSGLLERMRA